MMAGKSAPTARVAVRRSARRASSSLAGLPLSVTGPAEAGGSMESTGAELAAASVELPTVATAPPAVISETLRLSTRTKSPFCDVHVHCRHRPRVVARKDRGSSGSGHAQKPSYDQ